MGLADVNSQELCAVFVIVIELGEVAYLAAKRRSGVTPEYKHKRAPASAITKRKPRLAIERDQFHVGCWIPDAQVATMPVRQRVPQEAIHVARPAHEMAQHAITKRQDHTYCNRRPFPPAQVHPASCKTEP